MALSKHLGKFASFLGNLIPGNVGMSMLKAISGPVAHGLGEVVSNLFKGNVPVDVRELKPFKAPLREIFDNRRNRQKIKEICGRKCKLLLRALLTMKPVLMKTLSGI